MTRQQDKTENVPNYVLHWLYLMALVPYYDEEGGTWTQAIYFDGKTESYRCSCEQILEDLAEVFHTSLHLARGHAKKLGKQSRWGELRKVPLALLKSYIFVPVKCRSEKKRNSGALGYVVYQHVERVKPAGRGKCIIYFKNGSSPFEVKQDYDGVMYQMKLAQCVMKNLEAKEQHWQYERCIAHNMMCKKISENRTDTKKSKRE